MLKKNKISNITFSDYLNKLLCETNTVKPFNYTYTINISNRNIVDLNGIEQFTNLQSLYCNGNHIKSLEPLSSLISVKTLHNLQELLLSNNNITSLEDLKDLKKLRILECDDNKLSSLQGLEKLPNLKELNFSYNSIESLKPIKNLKKLTSFIGNNNPIKKIYKEVLFMDKLVFFSINNHRYDARVLKQKIKYLDSLKSLII